MAIKRSSRAQQRRVNAACRRFKNRMQAVVNNGSDVERISIQIANGPEITIAEKSRETGGD